MTRAEKPTIKHIYQNYILDSTYWNGLQVREGDIVIAISYKTGTPWMQGICAALVFRAPEPPAPQDDLSPWLDARFAPPEETLAALDGLTHRRYIKTHSPLDGLPFSDRIKYIVVGRDGLDMFMSLWHHWNNMRPESIDQINATPGRVGDPLPLPPADIHAAFDTWLDTDRLLRKEQGCPPRGAVPRALRGGQPARRDLACLDHGLSRRVGNLRRGSCRRGRRPPHCGDA
jgi:aryl sulfotransferase